MYYQQGYFMYTMQSEQLSFNLKKDGLEKLERETFNGMSIVEKAFL